MGLRIVVAMLLAMALSWPARAGEDVPLYFIRSGELHGLIDATGRVLLPPEFTEIKLGSPLIMVRKGYKTAYVDRQGKMVIPPQEKLTQPFSEGLTPATGLDAQGKQRWGYADASGALLIRPAFDSAEGFVDGLAVVGLADEWGTTKFGVIDRQGKWVLPATHVKLLTPGGGLVRSELPGRTHRVYDRNGRDLTPEGVDFVGITQEGMVRVWKGREQGFMTVTGELAVSPRFAQASDFRGGLARVWVDGKYGFIDKTGKMVVEPRFDTAEDFSDGLALVKEGGRQLFIDANGKVVLSPEADRVWPFAEGMAVFKSGNKHGYLDKTGKFAIAPAFSFARPFANGLAHVGLPRSESAAAVSGYIRPDGQFVWRDAP